MKIEKLELKGFGKLNNLTLDFKTGLNVVFGNNETGKSSIQWFIRGMFYGLKGGRATKEGLLPSIKKFRPWNSSDYSGIIGYSLDSGEKFKVERNYNTNSIHVYDSSFNDITNTFDATRDKGVQFADRHLGMNEACFDKTVFIRQMESKVDDDGSKELMNRLTNVAQTGFEDISFRKAQEALREALKNYVGNDKTSTRPLDKVIARMEQLESQRNDLIEKRASLFTIENELNTAVNMRNKLQNRKQVYSLIKEVLEIEKRVANNIKLKNGLDETINNINIEEEQLKVTSKSAEEFNKTKSELEKFSSFNNDDADTIGLQYYEMLRIKETNKKLGNEILVKTAEKENIKFQLNRLKAFESLGDDVETSLMDLNRDLEQLKAEYEKNNLEVLNERIKTAKYKDNRGKYNIIASALLSVLFILIGLYKIPLGYMAALVGVITTIVLFVIRRKSSRELFDLLNQKKVSFVSVSSIIDETNRKQNTLKGILNSVDAKSMEEFLKLKAEYDNRAPQLNSIVESIRQMESEFGSNALRIKKLDESIKEKLFTAEIITDESVEIKEEDIKNFKYGVRRYDGVVPSINYTLQRIEDINKNLLGLYNKAAALYGTKIEEKDKIAEFVCKTEIEINEETEKLNKTVDDLKKAIYEKDVTVPGIFNIDKILEGSNLSNISVLIENECTSLEAEYNDTLLKIRECETLLKSLSGDDEEIQRIDEEIGELEAKKNQLQDTNISLKTALEILTEASTEIQRDFAPALNYKMSDTIKRITNGRYTDLRADDNLSLKAIAPETGDVVTALALSGGTADQMYLALRIAMADLIATNAERIPLVLDEVFAQYDDIRTKDAFEFLNGLSEERQVIFFTCKGREVEIAREVCGDRVNIIELC